jgi:hypothetical protein
VTISNRRGVFKRTANVPRAITQALPPLSKADLLEAALDLASLQNPNSCDDDDETIASLIGVLNRRRVGRGQKDLKRREPKPTKRPTKRPGTVPKCACGMVLNAREIREGGTCSKCRANP